MQTLNHEDFQGAQVLADIGTKIAASRALFAELERDTEDFLVGREAEAAARIQKVLVQSRGLLDEIGKNHTALVGYRTEVENYMADVRCLIQAIEGWKNDFDARNTEILADIEVKSKENEQILTEIKAQRALLAGESKGITTKRAALREETKKITDEWATLGRAKKEITKN